MKNIWTPFLALIVLICLVSFVHAQTHSSSSDNKSVSSITFDDNNSPGSVKVKAPSGMTTTYTITLPKETGTIVTTASTGTSTQTVALTGAVSGSGTTSIATTLANTIVQAGNVNWIAFHALDVSYGSHSGINWQSLGA